jgi:predicted AAA+ superfamily ATPase
LERKNIKTSFTSILNKIKSTFLFEGQLLPHTIIADLSICLGKKIEAKDTLLFFDEIQVLPEVLTSLKYFNEQAPEYHIISAGSLLGVSITSHTSFPVGKINFLSMNPMSFLEYLEAIGEKLLADKVQSIKKGQVSGLSMKDVFHEKLMTYLKMYFFFGGMPEVIQHYIDNRDIVAVRRIQNDILEAYKRDFSKYNDKIQALKTSEIWNSLPAQLSKEIKSLNTAMSKKMHGHLLLSIPLNG